MVIRIRGGGGGGGRAEPCLPVRCEISHSVRQACVCIGVCDMCTSLCLSMCVCVGEVACKVNGRQWPSIFPDVLTPSEHQERCVLGKLRLFHLKV